MKTPADIAKAVRGRLQGTWHLDATGSGSSWPYTITLGSHTSTQLAADFPATRQQVQALRDWAGANDIAVTDIKRRVQGTIQPIPPHVTVRRHRRGRPPGGQGVG